MKFRFYLNVPELLSSPTYKNSEYRDPLSNDYWFVTKINKDRQSQVEQLARDCNGGYLINGRKLPRTIGFQDGKLQFDNDDHQNKFENYLKHHFGDKAETLILKHNQQGSQIISALISKIIDSGEYATFSLNKDDNNTTKTTNYKMKNGNVICEVTLNRIRIRKTNGPDIPTAKDQVDIIEGPIKIRYHLTDEGFQLDYVTTDNQRVVDLLMGEDYSGPEKLTALQKFLQSFRLLNPKPEETSFSCRFTKAAVDIYGKTQPRAFFDLPDTEGAPSNWFGKLVYIAKICATVLNSPPAFFKNWLLTMPLVLIPRIGEETALFAIDNIKRDIANSKTTAEKVKNIFVWTFPTLICLALYLTCKMTGFFTAKLCNPFREMKAAFKWGAKYHPALGVILAIGSAILSIAMIGGAAMALTMISPVLFGTVGLGLAAICTIGVLAAIGAGVYLLGRVIGKFATWLSSKFAKFDPPPAPSEGAAPAITTALVSDVTARPSAAIDIQPQPHIVVNQNSTPAVYGSNIVNTPSATISSLTRSL